LRKNQKTSFFNTFFGPKKFRKSTTQPLEPIKILGSEKRAKFFVIFFVTKIKNNFLKFLKFFIFFEKKFKKNLKNNFIFVRLFKGRK